jgi:hypothetical protein
MGARDRSFASPRMTIFGWGTPNGGGSKKS